MHRLELSVALASILGVCVGWIMRGVTLSKRLGKERAIEYEAEHDERMRKSIRELDPSIKALMRVTVEYGRAYVHSNDPKLYMLVDIDFFSQFFAVEHVDGGVAKITATPALKQVYGLMPELFECVTVTMNEHVRKDGERVIARFSIRDTAPDWWWFRPKKKPSQVN